MPLPPGTTAKMLEVKIKAKHLRVALKAKPNEPLVDGELAEKVKVDDSFWSVEDGHFLNINFEKAYEAIWKCVILGDEEIDTKKVDEYESRREKTLQ